MHDLSPPRADHACGRPNTTTVDRRLSGRRLGRVPIIGLGALLVLGLAAPVSAGKPDIAWIGMETILFDGYCTFPVLLQDSHSSSKEIAFPPDRADVERIVAAGSFRSTFTNLVSGASIEGVTTGGALTFAITAETLRVDANGTTLYWYTAEEAAVSQLGQGLFIGRGRGLEVWGPDGLLRAEFTGTVTDLCEVLAG